MEPISTNNQLPRICIVGGGAGGLELAVRLGRKLGKRHKAQITLIDASRTHVWKPLLHQLAAGTLDTHADELEYFALARKHSFNFRLGKMDGLNRVEKKIYLAPTYTAEGEEVLPRQAIAYDTLVLAVGSLSNDFGTTGAQAHCIRLDSPVEAERFHQRLITQYLRMQASEQNTSSAITVTIIGAGATGVELAAELRMTSQILSSYGLVNLDPERDFKIAVVEAASRLLPMLPPRLSQSVAYELSALKIDIYINEKVVEISKAGITMASGKFIPSSIVVWAAGIKAPAFLNNLDGLETNRINQLVVQPTLQSTRDPAIFAFGDCAACPQNEGSSTVPPRAQAAHQQAAMLSKSLSRMLQNKSLLSFTFKDHGSLVSLGNYRAVGSLMGSIARGSLFIEGKIAQLMYWALHKQHQITVNGWFYTLLSTCAEMINRVRNPRIKLH